MQIRPDERARLTSVPTVDPRARQPEGFFAGLLIIEALDEASLRNAMQRAAEVAPEATGRVGDPEFYQAIFALDPRIASFE